MDAVLEIAVCLAAVSGLLLLIGAVRKKPNRLLVSIFVVSIYAFFVCVSAAVPGSFKEKLGSVLSGVSLVTFVIALIRIAYALIRKQERGIWIKVAVSAFCAFAIGLVLMPSHTKSAGSIASARKPSAKHVQNRLRDQASPLNHIRCPKIRRPQIPKY